MFASTVKSIFCLLVVTAASGSRFGLLRVGTPSRVAAQVDMASESSRSLLDEDFQAYVRFTPSLSVCSLKLALHSVYRQLFAYPSASAADLSLARLDQLSMAPFSMAPFSMAPFSMAPFSMAPFSMAPLSMGQLGLSMTYSPSSTTDLPSRLGVESTESDATRDNNSDSTQGGGNTTSSRSAFNAGMTGGLSAACVALVVAAVAYKLKKSAAAASSQQSVASDESSLPSLPAAV